MKSLPADRFTRLHNREPLFVFAGITVLLSACGGNGGASPSASSPSSTSTSAASKYVVGGTVTGLSGSGLVLENNGSDRVTVSTSGAFVFATPLATGQSFYVSVASQPSSGQACAVTAGATGSVASTNVSDIAVVCPAAEAQASSTATAFTIAEYAVPNLQPGLANVSDGKLWGISSVWSSSGNTWTNSINQISPDGTVQTIALTGVAMTSVPLAAPLAGPDGKLWDNYNGAVFDIALTGAGTSLFTLAGLPELFDGTGALWYAGSSGSEAGNGIGDTLGSVTQTGSAVVSATFATTPNAVSGMALGRDDSVWFTSSTGNQVGFITQSGVITTYPLPTHADNVNPDGTAEGSLPAAIALGADGNMWFVERAQPTQRIGVITPSGVITEYTVAANSGYVLGDSIAVGPDGNMWFAIWGGEVGYITPSGVSATSTTPTAASWPSSMNVGPDGRMWFTEPANLAPSGKVGAISVTIPMPINDNFANATMLSGAAGFLYSNDFTATAEAGEPSTAGVTPTKTLWWQWTAPSSGTLVVSTFGSSYETVVGLYTGSELTNLTSVAAAHQGGPGLTSLSAPVQAGVTYDFVVDGNKAAAGVLLFDWRMQ